MLIGLFGGNELKICILSIVNVKHMSLISLYTSILDSLGLSYDIIYIDKYSKIEKTNAETVYRYNLKIEKHWSKNEKIFKYLGFRKYAKKILTEKKYDLVIVWGVEASLMFFDYLIQKMKGKYIVNIRDYPLIKKKIVFFILKLIINNSRFTTISSNGFKSFLPEYNYINIHSLNMSILNEAQKRKGLQETTKKIKICFIGYVRFLEKDKQLMNALKNDERYILQFFGAGSEALESFAQKEKIYNVEFIHSFDVEQTAELLLRADIINNLYGNKDIALDTAISIKYYYAAYLRIPILVYKNTYMEQISKEIGYVFDEEYNDLGDKLFNWYHSINFERFSEKCDAIINNAEKENELFKKIFKNVLEG
jgi:hypothetical protein